MASIRTRANSVSDEKLNFECCKTKKFSNVVCVKCGKAYHASCAARDWAAEVVIIDKTRCICAEHGITSNNEIEEAEKIQLLKDVIVGLKEKNALLEENKRLLEEKISNFEKYACKNKSKQTEKKDKKCEESKESKECNVENNSSSQTQSKSNRNPAPKTKVPEEINASDIDVPILNSKNPQDGYCVETENDLKSTPSSSSQTNHNLLEEITENERKKEDDIDIIDIDNSDEAKWRKVSYKKNNRNKQYPMNSSRPKPVRGANENISLLKPAQRMSFLFISGLAPDMTSSMVMEYLEEKNLKTNCSCDKMKTKKEKYISSFRLAVPYCDRDKYLNPNLWPTNTIINHFMNLQSHKTGQKTLLTQNRE